MFGREKSEEQKRREQMQEQASIQDSISTNQLEAGLVSQRKDQQENTRNQLLDTAEVKQQLKQSLLGMQPIQVPATVYECSECSSNFNNKVEECGQCSSKDIKQKQSQTRYVTKWVKTSEKQLVNQKGFDMIWSEVQASINENLTGSYLPSKVIDNVVYSTCGTIIKQIYGNYWEYGVQNVDDAAQIVDIVRKNVLATANKARGGRALKSQEKTVIEKISRMSSDGDDDDDKKGPGGIF